MMETRLACSEARVVVDRLAWHEDQKRIARAALPVHALAQRPFAGARFLRVMLSEMPTPVAF